MLGTDPKSKNAMLFVLITVVINSVGFGIMIPVLPDLLKELTDLPNNQAVIWGYVADLYLRPLPIYLHAHCWRAV